MKRMGQPGRVAEVLQQIQDLRLDGNVERGGRLVADQQRGLGRERPRDRDALALAAREGEGVARADRGFEADGLEQAGGIGRRLGAARREAIEQDRLRQGRGDAHARVEGGIGILEDHLQGALAGGVRLCCHVPAAEEDPPAGRPHEAGDDVRDRRLAAARFADEAEDLALSDRERDVVHGPEDLARPSRQNAARSVVDGEVLDGQKRRAGVAGRRAVPSPRADAGGRGPRRPRRIRRPTTGKRASARSMRGTAPMRLRAHSRGVERRGPRPPGRSPRPCRDA